MDGGVSLFAGAVKFRKESSTFTKRHCINAKQERRTPASSDVSHAVLRSTAQHAPFIHQRPPPSCNRCIHHPRENERQRCVSCGLGSGATCLLLDHEGCGLLVNNSGWTCTQPGGRSKPHGAECAPADALHRQGPVRDSSEAEPDHMVLGKRLKGAFKSVTASIKSLSNEQLEAFQKTGSIVVDGHELHEDDLRLMYTFDQNSGSAAQYEAHSDAQVLVLLDVTPDQSMVDEGVAREVINRIQKLRKKAHLVPSDEITVYYQCQPKGEYLDSVIQAHNDFILATTKAPMLPFPVPKNSSVIIEEKTQLKGSDLEFTIVKGSTAPKISLNGPACAYVNLKVKENNKEQDGVVLLENPKGDNKIDMNKLKFVCSSIFGTDSKVRFYNGTTELSSKTDLQSLSGKTLVATSASSSPGSVSSDSPLCPYVNLVLCNAKPSECQTGEVGTLLLKNPAGQNGLLYSQLHQEVAKVFGLRGRRLKLYLDQTSAKVGITLLPL
ncbi:hypothetical protein WMY93_011694 [Mugilogobius chulae]|uniref:Isoleucine--tRNA ligase cytoplasmic ubiquitin-like domain-containing protein n=1 Tax=Mugilogobius chulae TaxID=88201 RepID=A0AAW0P9F0_9GOBI